MTHSSAVAAFIGELSSPWKLLVMVLWISWGGTTHFCADGVDVTHTGA